MANRPIHDESTLYVTSNMSVSELENYGGMGSSNIWCVSP